MIKKRLRIHAKSLSDALAPSKKKIASGAGLRRLCEASAFIPGVPIVCQIFARKAGAIYVCISFLRAVIFVLVVSVIILIHFVVVIFSLRMHAQQVFSVLFTGVLNAIACICRRGVSGGFPAGLRFAFVSSVRDSFGHGKCLPIFYRGLMCMCCVCVIRTRTHTACGVLGDSWSLSHLGYLYPRTTPVMIKLDHDRSCPWV